MNKWKASHSVDCSFHSTRLLTLVYWNLLDMHIEALKSSIHSSILWHSSAWVTAALTTQPVLNSNVHCLICNTGRVNTWLPYKVLQFFLFTALDGDLVESLSGTDDKERTHNADGRDNNTTPILSHSYSHSFCSPAGLSARASFILQVYVPFLFNL